MAVIYNAQGKKKDVASQPTEQPLAPSAPAAGGAAPQATAAPKQAGSGFTDLSTYLKANKKGIENTASTLAKNAVGNVDTTVNAPKVASIDNTTVDLAGDTSGAVNDLNKTYDTTTYENELANSTAGKYQSAGQAVGATSALAAGNINQTLAGINGGVRGGIRNLTAFGVQRDPNAQQTFQKAAQDAQVNAATLAANSKAAAEKIAQGGKDFDDRRGKLVTAIKEAQDQEKKRELSRVGLATQDVVRSTPALSLEELRSLVDDPNAAYTGGTGNLDADLQKWADNYNFMSGAGYYNPATKASVGYRSTGDQQRMDALAKLMTAGGVEQQDFSDAALIRDSGVTGQDQSFDKLGFKKGLKDYINKHRKIKEAEAPVTKAPQETSHTFTSGNKTTSTSENKSTTTAGKTTKTTSKPKSNNNRKIGR
jgi:hypothetical protein